MGKKAHAQTCAHAHQTCSDVIHLQRCSSSAGFAEADQKVIQVHDIDGRVLKDIVQAMMVGEVCNEPALGIVECPIPSSSARIDQSAQVLSCIAPRAHFMYCNVRWSQAHDALTSPICVSPDLP